MLFELASMAVVALGLLGQEPSAAVRREAALMGTRLGVVVGAADRAAALAASEAALRAVAAVESRWSDWRDDSELARCNATPAGVAFAASPEFACELAAALRWWRATDGWFDPALGALVAAYDLRGAGGWPARAEIERLAAVGGARHIELSAGFVTRGHADAVLAAGAFGKGLALDVAWAAARDVGAISLRADFGGQVFAVGTAPEWLALAHPRRRDEPCCVLEFAAGSIATSGNSERGRVVAGRLLPHLLDPRSGQPAADWGSLAVLATDGLAADCLSTGLAIAGPDAALAYAAVHPEVAVVAFVADPEDRAVRVRASANLRGRLRAAAPGVALEFAPAPDKPASHQEQ